MRLLCHLSYGPKSEADGTRTRSLRLLSYIAGMSVRIPDHPGGSGGRRSDVPRRAGRRPKEGRGEVIAREVVAHYLGATIERYDDGTTDAMLDGLARYPDGATALPEVVGDHLPAYNAERTALEQRGHRRLTVEGLRWHWVLSIEVTVDARPVRRALPGLLRRAEALHPDNPWQAGGRCGRASSTSRMPTRTASTTGSAWACPPRPPTRTGSRGRQAHERALRRVRARARRRHRLGRGRAGPRG